ncbi:MFS transporter [Gloeothece verrucosa]|uniref:Major facilitator superfamily MFS_1 n=1 Tax=Gloeothece verrucosa (strain PCC 7822) TaxID=497965 RepID=E0U650_GLOV7|nr:MFS transporter [Gloeothece verrucosa]ADN12386.1 major facilitator superfamily MFS_1 [Gloeothece verrucosa PCC 7822]
MLPPTSLPQLSLDSQAGNMFKIEDKIIIKQPSFFIPSLYFAEGLPYIIINTVSVIIYKNLGIDNGKIAFWTSLLYLPWVLKMFWSPWVECYSTKRNWILLTQLTMTGCLALLAFSLHLNDFFGVSLLILTLGAFVSATHDIAADGFYLLALNPQQQAVFAGIRSIFYRGAVIFGSGFLVFLTGYLAEKSGNIRLSWTVSLGVSAMVFALIFIYHQFSLPYPPQDSFVSSSKRLSKNAFLEIITSYFRQPKIGAIIGFILLYRFGEAMLLKLAAPFFLDKPAQGGLGLSTSDVGLIYGTFGVLALIIGGIFGGIIVAKYGLKKTILPLAISLNAPNLFYVYMAVNHPPLPVIYLLVALEQLGYGMGFTAFMIYLMKIAANHYQTSHYAISTGIMALGMMLPGLISGYIQQAIGYPLFFTLVCGLGLLGIASIFFLPWHEENQTD